jgi:hypothetical protein
MRCHINKRPAFRGKGGAPLSPLAAPDKKMHFFFYHFGPFVVRQQMKRELYPVRGGLESF